MNRSLTTARPRAAFSSVVIVFVAILTGCAAGGATPNPSPSQPPLLIDVNKLITWEVTPGELTGVMVIQQLQNISDHWIQVSARESDYEIKASNGNVVAAGNFRYAYPTYLAPGDTGYLIDQFLEGDAPIANLTNLTVDARFRDINEKPTRRLEAQNTTVRSSDVLPGGLYVTGEAQNVGEEDVVSAHVGAVFFDAAGAIIGASTSDDLQHVVVGSKEAFETRPGNPLDQTTVANFVVYASPTI
jgi:hypothetical protein